MPITRINHFTAKPGFEQALHDFLAAVISTIEACPGCISCRLLRALDDEAQLAIIEEWDSVAAHQAAAKAIPPEQMARAMALFAKPPTGIYYAS